MSIALADRPPGTGQRPAPAASRRAEEASGAVPLPRIALLTAGRDKPYALGLASSLLARNVAFDFIGSDEVDGPHLHGNPLVRFLNLRGNQRPDVSLLTKSRRTLLYYFRLLKYAATSKGGVFHILWNNKFEIFDRTLLLVFYRLLGKRLVHTAHNVNISRRDGNDTRLNRWTLRIQYRLLHHIFVHTEPMKQELESDFAVPAEKISIIPFGINSTVPNTALTSSEARKRLGLAANDKVVLFFGYIAPYKGLHYLVEALIRLVPTEPLHRLVIAGKPKHGADYWQAIQRRISQSGLQSRVVQRIEYVPDEEAEVFFKAADVLVLPYTHVFQSGVLFLSYNFGLPVVAADVGSFREDILEGRTGFVCKPADAEDLAATLSRFFASSLYQELARRRSEISDFARQRHSWDTVGEITQAVYARLCG